MDFDKEIKKIEKRLSYLEGKRVDKIKKELNRTIENCLRLIQYILKQQK